ncbi:MAG: hypothetical protein RMY62_018985 [Nostoc sp. ZfuVER08]|uniref:hypothetical protein n=1 Tax=Nostoc punctiforme TaxID=272131 RepID=UPI001684A71A|nr:hypothetical protein [Nostoc punctiforme]
MRDSYNGLQAKNGCRATQHFADLLGKVLPQPNQQTPLTRIGYWRRLIGECGDEKDGIWKKYLEKIVKINVSSLLFSGKKVVAFADIGIRYFA